jgi:hypothetical protein
MRVTCHTPAEFLEALGAETAILQNAVRVSQTRKPIDGVNGGWKNATKIEITLQLTAVVLVADEEGGGQYLLEAGFITGVDYVDASQELGGSEAAAGVLKLVEELCLARGWRTLPGVIQI